MAVYPSNMSTSDSLPVSPAGKAALTAAAEGASAPALATSEEADPPPAKKARKGKKGAQAAAAKRKAQAAAVDARDPINLDDGESRPVCPLCNANSSCPTKASQRLIPMDDAALIPSAEGFVGPYAAEVVFEASTHVPAKECFHFEPVPDSLQRSGCYLLQYQLQPAILEAGSLSLDVLLEVQPGAVAGFELQVREILWSEGLPFYYCMCMRAEGRVLICRGAGWLMLPALN